MNESTTSRTSSSVSGVPGGGGAEAVSADGHELQRIAEITRFDDPVAAPKLAAAFPGSARQSAPSIVADTTPGAASAGAVVRSAHPVSRTNEHNPVRCQRGARLLPRFGDSKRPHSTGGYRMDDVVKGEGDTNHFPANAVAKAASERPLYGIPCQAIVIICVTARCNAALRFPTLSDLPITRRGIPGKPGERESNATSLHDRVVDRDQPCSYRVPGAAHRIERGS